MAPSSSAKKVARLAQRGKGKKVRFQGGTVFPLVIVGVIVAGLALVAYARSSVPGFDSEAAAALQARVAFGVYVCDEWVELGEPVADDPFTEFGVAPLDIGVATVQALPADGNRGARLGNLMDAYGVDLSDSRIRLPDGRSFDRNTDQCDGRNASLSVTTWEGPDDLGSGQVSIAGLRDVRLDTNPMVVTVAFASGNATITQPESVDGLIVPAGPDFGDFDFGDFDLDDFDLDDFDLGDFDLDDLDIDFEIDDGEG